MTFNFRYIFVCLTISVFAFVPKIEGKDFVGEITYSIQFEEDIDPSIKEMLPKQATLLIKNKKSNLITESGIGKQSTIYNHQKRISYSLIDLLTPPVAIKKNEIDILNDRKQHQIKGIKHTKDTKLILGNRCRKVIITLYIPQLDETVNLEAYYTTNLGLEWINESDPIYHPVKGLLLEYEVQVRSTFIKYTVTDILKRKVSDKELKVPKNYKTINAIEAQSYFNSLK